MQFIFSNQIVLAALSLDLFAVLFGGAVALLPIFAKDILHTGPDGLGYLRAAPAVGSVLMAVLLTYFPLRRRAGRKLLWAVAGFGLATIGFALSKSFWLSLFLLFLTGVFDSVSVIVRSTLHAHLHAGIHERARFGREQHLYRLLATKSAPLKAARRRSSWARCHRWCLAGYDFAGGGHYSFESQQAAAPGFNARTSASSRNLAWVFAVLAVRTYWGAFLLTKSNK